MGVRGGRDGGRLGERAAVERGGEDAEATLRALGSGSGRRASRCAARQPAETHEARSPVDARGSTLERSATSGSPVSRDQSKMLCVGVGDDKPDRLRAAKNFPTGGHSRSKANV